MESMIPSICVMDCGRASRNTRGPLLGFFSELGTPPYNESIPDRHSTGVMPAIRSNRSPRWRRSDRDQEATARPSPLSTQSSPEVIDHRAYLKSTNRGLQQSTQFALERQSAFRDRTGPQTPIRRLNVG